MLCTPWEISPIYSILYSIYRIFIKFKLTFKSWILTSKKKGPSCPNWGDGGGGLGDSGNARKKTFFFRWPLPLVLLEDDCKIIWSEPWLVANWALLSCNLKIFIFPIFPSLGHRSSGSSGIPTGWRGRVPWHLGLNFGWRHKLLPHCKWN